MAHTLTTPIRVLLIEDNPADARLATEWLRDAGTFEIAYAERLEPGIQALAGHTEFDVIALDLSLPDSTGLATFHRVRDAAPDVPIVVVTGFADERAARDAVHAGAQDYLVKDDIMGRVLPRALTYAVERQRFARDVKRLETELRQAQRLEALGTLAGGIAHDFNNLLTAITGYYGLMKEEIPSGTPLAADLEEIGKAARIAASLTEQLLEFCRKQQMTRTIVDVNEVVSTLERMLGRVLREDIRISLVLADRPLPVLFDRPRLEQILLNLAVNARDAMPDGGTLTIETRSVGRAGGAAGEWARILVSDTGCGMEPEIRERIFEPFFTTKPRGRGTGLGLSTVHGIVHQSGGEIGVESIPGQGTTFRIDFPMTLDEEEAPRKDQPKVAPVVSAQPLVLVVDDEPAIRAIVAQTLERQGCEVITAADPAEAHAIAAAATRPIDLVICDVVLPDVPGTAVVADIRKQWPAVRVMLMSGYNDADEGAVSAADVFLPKPFTPADVRAAVAQLLPQKT